VKRFVLSAAALSFVLFASPSRAEDFEFSVPVQLAKLDPAFTQGKVLCDVRGRTGSPESLPSANARAVIGAGETAFPIAQGAYNGTVVVKFDAKRPEFQPSQADQYRCILHLIGAGGVDGALCSLDALTGQPTGATPGWLNLSPKSFKGCVVGTLPH